MDYNLGNQLAGQITRLFYTAAGNVNSKMADQDKFEDPEEKKNESGEEEASGEEDIFEVDYIMDTRMKSGSRYFHVRWKGYDSNEDSWEPEANLEGAKDIVENFMKNLKDKKPFRSKKPERKEPRKRGRPSTNNSSARSSVVYKEEPPSDDNEKESDNDDDYGSSSAKKAKTIKPTPSTSQAAQSTSSFLRGSMSNLVSRRIDTSNKLRWLESDSSSEDEEAKKPPPPPKAEEEKNPFSSSFTAPPPQQHQLEVPDNFLEESPNASQESDKAKDPKKKKKKNKKHSRDRERSAESDKRPEKKPEEGTRSLQFSGAYQPVGSSETMLIAKETTTGNDVILSLHEAYVRDSWGLASFLYNNIQFTDGPLKVTLPRRP